MAAIFVASVRLMTKIVQRPTLNIPRTDEKVRGIHVTWWGGSRLKTSEQCVWITHRALRYSVVSVIRFPSRTLTFSQWFCVWGKRTLLSNKQVCQRKSIWCLKEMRCEKLPAALHVWPITSFLRPAVTYSCFHFFNWFLLCTLRHSKYSLTDRSKARPCDRFPEHNIAMCISAPFPLNSSGCCVIWTKQVGVSH